MTARPCSGAVTNGGIGSGEESEGRIVCHCVMRAMRVALLVCLLVTSDLLVAQVDTTNQSTAPTLCEDALAALHDGGRIFTSPLRFSSMDWLLAGGVIGGTALLFSVDEFVRDAVRRNSSSTGDWLSSMGREYGREVNAFLFSGGLYIGGVLFDKPGVRRTGLQVFEAVAISGIVTSIIKSLAGRRRPYLNNGPDRFEGFQFRHETTSLPSGHSTVAFAMSTVLAKEIDNPYATAGLYSLATITALSRIYDDEHWASDTFLGAAIGAAVGFSVVHLHESAGGTSSLHVVPGPGGLNVHMDF